MEISTIWIIWYGQFWKFIHELCKIYFPDIEVLISSRTFDKAQPFDQVCKADIVFPCGPIKYMQQQLEDIIPLLWEDSILWEVTTVKVMPVKILHKNTNINYIASHPMFGPESYSKNWDSLTWCTIAWCEDTLSIESREVFQSKLREFGLNIVDLSADQHDKHLAETLFLTHYVSQIIYQAWFDRSKIDTLSFGYLMDAVESVKDNEWLFKDVRNFNPYCKEVVERFAKTNKDILESL